MAIDFPGSPINGQTYQGYVYNSSIPAWQAKPNAQSPFYTGDTPPGNPVSGDSWFNTSDGTMYIYFYDGNSYQWVEHRSQLSKNHVGLVPITPTSITVGAGSGTVNALGLITVTNVTSVTLNGIFNSNYENYRLISNLTVSTLELRHRYSINGTVQATADYGWAGSSSTSAGGSSIYSGSGLDWSALGAFSAASSTGFTADFYSPAVAGRITRGNFHVGAWNGTWFNVVFSSAWNNANAVDGTTFYSTTAATFSGTFKVYGYN